jgi:DNA replication protein DnaC
MSDQNDPFNPTMRPIEPADIPRPRAARATPPAAPNSATPDGWIDSSPKPKTVSCEICQDVGYFALKVTYGHPQFGKIQKCTCRAYQERLAPRAAKLRDELGDLAGKTFDSFDLARPLKMATWQAKPISVAAQHQFLLAAHRRCKAWSETPTGWLYLHGAFGAGKSHLAAAIANSWTQRGVARFLTVGKLLDTLTMTIRDGTTDSLLIDLLQCDLLILDELSAAHLSEAASDWRFGRIERIINERLDKPTVITSNLAIDDLALPGDIRAERLSDRIAGVSQIVWMPIASYRRIGSEVAS